MKTIPLPLAGKVYKNIDGIELSDESQLLLDGYLDEKGGTHKRPGLALEKDLGLGTNNGIDGIFWWGAKGYAICVSGGKVYKLTRSGGVISSTDLTGTGTPELDTPVSFAANEDYLFMANGGRIFYTDGTATTIYIADAHAPITVTHIAFIDGYLMANVVGSTDFQWSELDNPLSWIATDVSNADGNPDYVTALHIFSREIYLFGPNTLEVWENDGVAPFGRIPGGFYEIGTIAPYSVVNTNTSLFWLDQSKHFVERSLSGDVKYIVSDYDKEIQSFETVSDCRGERIEIDGKPFLLFHFPGENRTLVYNYRDETWSEWGNYTGPSTTYDRWLGACYCFSPEWNLHLVGARHNSLIYSLSASNYTDNGDEIRLKRLTGHIDWGTPLMKRSSKLLLRLKRGGGEVSDAKFMLRWKDDNKSWSNEIEVSLGALGDYEIVKEIYPRGMYRTRQYEVTCTDAVPFIYIDAHETVEVLSR